MCNRTKNAHPRRVDLPKPFGFQSGVSQVRLRSVPISAFALSSFPILRDIFLEFALLIGGELPDGVHDHVVEESVESPECHLPGHVSKIGSLILKRRHLINDNRSQSDNFPNQFLQAKVLPKAVLTVTTGTLIGLA